MKPKWHVCYRVIQHVSHMLLKAHLVWRTNKLILLHTILHDETPLYLLNEILLQANHQSSYNLRLNRVFEPPFCNTTSYKCSCFPNVIDSWNLLDVDTQNQHSRLMFKKQIRSNISVPPPILPWVEENTTYSIQSSLYVTVCVLLRLLFSFYSFYFDFHSARIIFDVSSGFYLWNINKTTAWHL